MKLKYGEIKGALKMSERKKRGEQRQPTNRKGKRKQKLKFILSISILLMIVLTVGFVAYEIVTDTQTMGCKTFVYGQNVSRLTPDQATEKINTAFEDKTVSFYENGKSVYTVSLRELGYSLNTQTLETELFKLKKEIWKKRTIFEPREDWKIPYEIVRDDNRLSETLSAEHFTADTERISSEDAYIKYDDTSKKFIIVDAVQGNQIDPNRLLQYTSDCIQRNLEEDFSRKAISVDINENTYSQAAVTASSEELLSRLSELNTNIEKYNNTSITYLFGDVTETIDSATINSWMVISGDKVEIDSDKVRAYIESLASEYNTIYVPRSFYTSNGQTVTISNNEYGFRIDQDAEFEQFCADLQSGTTIQRSPIYEKEGLSRNGTDDLNGSYIEVSLEQQHLWLYKNGVLVTDTDVISGLPTEDRATYTGAYAIAYKASPFTLSSDIYGYEVPVTYWMPFVYGQGLHDADWQPEFGGDVYKTNGSHGCINLPPDQAEVIYNAIDGGYPIILY